MIRPLFAGLVAASILIASPLCQGALAADENARVIDGIAAIVNGEVITYSQVRAVSAPRERLLQSQFKGEELSKQVKEARDAALKDLIDRELIVQSFRKEKFELPGYVVEERVKEIIRDFWGGARPTFNKPWRPQNYPPPKLKKLEA